jgi:hypothetical protein
MATAADSRATTYKEKIPEKVVSHMEIRPNMSGGHNVELHHTHFDHPPAVKKFDGPHEPVSIPKGHILHHVAKQLGISMSDVGAGEDTEEATHETKEAAEA